MERMGAFENYLDYAKKIKGLLEKHSTSFELFIFGSIVKGNFSEFFSCPFEFHLLTKEQWNFYKKSDRYFCRAKDYLNEP